MEFIRLFFLPPILFAEMTFCVGSAGAQTPNIYTFSVVPQFSPAQLHREWWPVLDRVSRETGVALELKINASIQKFEADFMEGAPDFAYMNPYHAVMAKRAQAYLPLLRDSKPLAGILLVRRDSPYKSLRDLDGKTIAFPAPNAFGASLYLRALLAEEAKIRFEPRYLNTHSNVFRHVAQGNVAAGGGVNVSFNGEAPEVREQLAVLYQTPGVAPHPVVAHPRVPERVRTAVVEAFLALRRDAIGRDMLREIRMPQPVKSDYERDCRPLERLNIEKYQVLEKESRGG